MNDSELKAYWPELARVVQELQRAQQHAVAALLVDAVRAGATSGEILASIGGVLRDHGAIRSQLTKSGVEAWDAIMADVRRAYPGAGFGHWVARLFRRLN